MRCNQKASRIHEETGSQYCADHAEQFPPSIRLINCDGGACDATIHGPNHLFSIQEIRDIAISVEECCRRELPINAQNGAVFAIASLIERLK